MQRIKLDRTFDKVKQGKISINACSGHSIEHEIILMKEQTYMKSQDENESSIKMLMNIPIKQEHCQSCTVSNTKLMQLE